MRPTYEQTFNECLHEMFRRVGVRYTEKFCRQPDWYHKRSWTESSESEFRAWMVAMLRRRYRWTKRQALKEVGWFLLSYSWKSTPSGCLHVSKERRCK